ncbi:MAG: DUF3458 domain-containing protein [Lentisphaerae bacterium]|nr:DUF3458 domain-containing protein [Lentisphaerota bacterium]
MADYKYKRSDFEPRTVRQRHVDLYLNFTDGIVETNSRIVLSAMERIDRFYLDARSLNIRNVQLIGLDSLQDLSYEYHDRSNRLIIVLPKPVEAGAKIEIQTQVTCTPSDNILEGIYKDTTPDGCPQQYMSQCQQWGFQRISPIIDDCTAKSTFRTVIEADARYTHLISNGNVDSAKNPNKVPVLKNDDPSRKIITYLNNIPMAPYLFIVCVGTWDALTDEIVYPSGRRVMLEYLVPPGRTKGAIVPMQILKESILWQGRTQEYEYARDVYRTICMEKSNFGGMENVGNTTIITSAALVDEFTSDSRLEYAYSVIVHEFEHNQCGSDVTMETPFDMWLNEAFTVDVERQFVQSLFDPTCARLGAVDAMRSPITGPLAIEDAGYMGNIVREGFNDPDELVDGVTYVKAAEVINMLKLVLGPETFRKGKNLYFSRYGGSNANTDQFFQCFEEVSGKDLSQFKQEWLYRIGYPHVKARHLYDASAMRLRVIFTQQTSNPENGSAPFHIPIRMAAIDQNGADIPGTDKIIELTHNNEEIVFEKVPEPAFISFNRDCSFYGTFEDLSASRKSLMLQVVSDCNLFNRVEAMRQLTDFERIKLVKNAAAEIDEDWLVTYASILKNKDLSTGLKSYLLRIDESTMNREYLPWYRERYYARRKLLRAVASRYMDDLLSEYYAINTYVKSEQPKDGIEDRRLKAVLLRTIIATNTTDAQTIAETHFRKAWNITDRVSALSCINISDHPDRLGILAEARKEWENHLNAYTSYLSIIGSGEHDDVFEMIANEERTAPFKIQHPSHNRSLYLPMTTNNKILWTDRGIHWLAQSVVKMAPVNENTAIRLLACFQQVRNLADDLRLKVEDALHFMQEHIDAVAAPSVAGRIAAYLSNP